MNTIILIILGLLLMLTTVALCFSLWLNYLQRNTIIELSSIMKEQEKTIQDYIKPICDIAVGFNSLFVPFVPTEKPTHSKNLENNVTIMSDFKKKKHETDEHADT